MQVMSYTHHKIWGASPYGDRHANHLKIYSLISTLCMPPLRLFPFHYSKPALFGWVYICLWTSTVPFVWNCCNVSSDFQIALLLFLLLDAALPKKIRSELISQAHKSFVVHLKRRPSSQDNRIEIYRYNLITGSYSSYLSTLRIPAISLNHWMNKETF